MSHEIYYTSASEGIRPGQQGFCTVGASEGLPKPLLERLESLSGYRHQYEASSGGPANPVAYAHWVVRLGGKSHHVLSRICDSGFDYTKRNNSFAHHLVVEGDELAPAGPAWMLLRSGTMVESWDGRVGPIVRSGRLPRGDAGPARCAAWEQATGDAGWAGLLAESFSKNSGKPACILYAPGQDVLTLIDEAIRLLPANLRWEVTFNTYFTSVSASAVCAWRCCPAGTHAAEAVVRYAASGIVIDLTNIRQAGSLHDSPWVEMARTGRPMKQNSASGKSVAKSVARFWAGAKDQPTMPLAPVESEQIVATPDNSDLIDMPPDQLPSMRSVKPNVRIAAGATPRRIRPVPLEGTARPWQHVGVLYLLACMAIGTGTWLVIRAAREMSPPDTPPHRTGPATQENTNEGIPTPVVDQSIPVAKPVTLPISTPTTQTIHVAIPVTLPVVQPVTAATPRTLILQSPLDQPAKGAGVGDQTQHISLPPPNDDLQAATALGIQLPGDKPAFTCRDAGLSGTLASVPSGSPDRPGFVLRWSDAIGTTTAADVLTVQFDKTLRQLDLTWRTSIVLRRPEVAALTYWLVRTSPMTVSEPGKPVPRRIAFAPLELPPIDLSRGAGEIVLPQKFPASVRLEVQELPATWSAKIHLQWEASESDRRQPEDARQIIELERVESGKPTGIITTVRIQPGFKAIECDLTSKMDAYRAGIVSLTQDVSTIDTEIKKLVVDAETEIQQNEQEYSGRPKALEAANHKRRLALSDARRPLDVRKAENERLLSGYKQVLAWFADPPSFNIIVRLSDDAQLAVLRVRKDSR